MTLFELAMDTTKSVYVRHMAGLLSKGLTREQAIKRHQINCNIYEDDSVYYYNYVLESLEE